MSVLNINSKEDKLHVSFLLYANIWTLSQENLILLHVNSKGATAYQHSLIGAFIKAALAT